ncbi:hypothetical protein PISMIDRAFT_349808 [Pisolithus microcarpus 441]|uniref:Uncharacterized protein n=1 Tax=Pisolithus microcarpus 441 TaxID=765257 RepID=A0A0C9ZH75_9AGAM|nr:hypothetical protein PISMIDRAFT_349808 [Pisolithus microcarpus 441]
MIDSTGADTMPGATMPPLSSPDVAEDSPVGSADDSSPHVEEAPTKSPKTKRKKNQKAMRSGQILSMSSSSQMAAHDNARFATSDCAAGGELERKYKKADCVCTLTFPGVAPTANEIATLLYVTSKHEQKYRIDNTQCYWFAATVFEALKCIFVDAEENVTKHSGSKGKWHGISVPIKESVVEVRNEYYVLRNALAQEIEQKRRAELQVPCLLFDFTICTYHNPNSKKKKGSGNGKNARLQRKEPGQQRKLHNGNARKRKGNVRKRKGNVRKRKGNVRKRKGNVRKRKGNARKRKGNARKRKGNASNARRQKKRSRSCCANWRHRGQERVLHRFDGRRWSHVQRNNRM